MIEGSAETTRIERDLEETRARLDATIGALQQKLSPGQLLDQSLAYLKESGGGEFAHNLKANVQTHPMPVALIGIGLAWLMMGGGSAGQPAAQPRTPGRSDDWAGHYGADAAARAEAAAASVRRTASESAEAFQERLYLAKGKALGLSRNVGEALSDFGSRVDTAMQAASRSARGTARGVREAAGTAIDSTRDATGRAADAAMQATGRATDAARDAADRVAGYLQEQPLLVGAIGVSVGALLGALLPPTRTEDELLGGISDTLKDRAYEAADTAIAGGVRVADEAIEAGKETARNEGLTAEHAGDTAVRAGAKVADAAAGVRHVVEETVAAGRDAMEREFRQDEAGTARSGNGSPRGI